MSVINGFLMAAKQIARSSTINIETDELIPLGELAKQRLGKRPSPATLWRWRLRGVNGARLAVVKSGGCWMTTAEAFAEFLRQQTENCTPAITTDAPAERSAATKRKLKAAGLLS